MLKPVYVNEETHNRLKALVGKKAGLGIKSSIREEVEKAINKHLKGV